MEALIQTLGFPSSALLAVAFLLSVFALHQYAGERHAVRVLRSPRTSRILALQITWYGVGYLPSAMESLHTYTR